MSWKVWSMALGFALLGIATPGLAAAEEQQGWEFEVVPYGWAPGTFGTIEVLGRTAQVDATVKDLVELVWGDALAAGGYFSARHDRFSVFVDAFGGSIEESGAATVPIGQCCLSVDAKVELKPVIVDFALGYQLGQWSLSGRRRPLSLGVYAGTRYMHFGVGLSASARVSDPGLRRSADVSQSFNWADPMIGLRWEVPLLDRLSLDFRGDIGGFGASSDLIWGLVGDVRYWLPWTPWSVQPWLGAGYRAVVFDREFGAGDGIDLELRGPFSALGFVF